MPPFGGGMEIDMNNITINYDKKELLTLPLWVGDKIFLKLIEDKSCPFFSLRLEYCGEALVSAILNDKELDIGEVI